MTRFVPATAMTVPPSDGPELGLRDSTIGGSYRVRGTEEAGHHTSLSLPDVYCWPLSVTETATRPSAIGSSWRHDVLGTSHTMAS